MFFSFFRLDSTLGSVPTARDSIVLSRTHQNHSLSRYRTMPSSSQSRSGQITVLEHLQNLNERLTLVEQQMNTMTNLLQRIDDRMCQSNLT
jgi:hypothetical protein